MELLIKYGVAQTIYFPLITAGGTAFQTTWTPAAGETQVSKDGGAFANANGTPAHEGRGIWSLALTAAESQCERLVVSLSDSSTDIEDQAIICQTNMSGNLWGSIATPQFVVNTGLVSATTTTFQATATYPNAHTETTADHFIGRVVIFCDPSDALYGQAVAITDYAWDGTNSEFAFTTDTLTEAPSDGDLFIVV